MAAKSLQSCPTLCDPRDSCAPGSPVPGILQARTLEWVAISFIVLLSLSYSVLPCLQKPSADSKPLQHLWEEPSDCVLPPELLHPAAAWPRRVDGPERKNQDHLISFPPWVRHTSLQIPASPSRSKGEERHIQPLAQHLTHSRDRSRVTIDTCLWVRILLNLIQNLPHAVWDPGQVRFPCV